MKPTPKNTYFEHRIWTPKSLDRLSRTRLSQNFILRDFLYCASADARAITNAPEDAAQVIRAGTAICSELLEPLLQQYGRFAITYGYECRRSIDWGVQPCAQRASNPHNWDRQQGRSDPYARVDILPFCVEDGQTDKYEYGHWIMENLRLDLCMTWRRSNVFCLTVGPNPRECWLEWGRPSKGEPQQTVIVKKCRGILLNETSSTRNCSSPPN